GPSRLIAEGARHAFPRKGWPVSLRAGAGVSLLLVPAMLLLVGRAPGGIRSILEVGLCAHVMPWRLPRMLSAAGAGCLLAVAGYMLQRVTGNPMASPEIMGVSAGAILGVAVSLMFVGSASTIGLTTAAAVGSFIALLLVLAISV